MGIERVSHYIDNVLTEAQARMGLRHPASGHMVHEPGK